MFIRLLISLLLFICAGKGSDGDYYWREYIGILPNDALIAGEGYGYSIYIGHGPLESHGNLVGEIHPGIPHINVTGWPAYSVHDIDKYLQILCSAYLENFKWINATSDTLLTLKGLVIGGYEGEQLGVLYVGKATVDNQVRIGKVAGYYEGDEAYMNRLYLASETTNQSHVDNFEVLTYNA